MDMKKLLDIRTPLKRGAMIVLSHPIFLFFGAFVAVPKILSQFFFFGKSFEGGGIEVSQINMGNSPPLDMALFFFFVFITLAVGSFSIVMLVLLANRHENNEKSSKASLRKFALARVAPVIRLELLFVAFAIIIDVLVMAPGDIALARGLRGLSQALSFSALGLILSVSVLFFFLRQYAILYLSLSNISLRDSLENANRLFRLHIKETFLLGAALLFVELLSFFLLLFLFSLVGGILKGVPFPSFGKMLFEWALMIGTFSFLEAWNWASWTLFFRGIALPKEPEAVLQKPETVLQQESAVGLDKA